MPQLPDLTRQVDVRTISARLNRIFQPQGVSVAVVYEANRLQVALASLDVPDRASFPKQVMQVIRELHVPVRTLEVRAYRVGESAALWQQILPVNSHSLFAQGRKSHLASRSSQTRLPTPQISARSVQPQSRLPNQSHRQTLHRTGQSPAVKHAQADIITQAKMGDIQAIRSLVRQALSSYPKLRHTETLANGTLRLTVESQSYLGGPTFASELVTYLAPIGGDRVRELAIYKRKFADAQPFLIQRVSLLPETLAETPVDRSSQNTQPAPIGVKLIALLYGLVGGINFLIAMAMAGILIASAVAVNNAPNVLVMFPYMASVLFTALAIAAGAFLVAIGLWNCKRWSLRLSYCLAGFMLLRGAQMLLEIWGTSTVIVNLEIAGIVVMGLILFYLTRRSVSDIFR